MNKLLEVALTFRPRRNALKRTDEEIELAVAWLKGGITMVGLNAALKEVGNSINAMNWLAPSLRQAFEEGKIKIVESK